MSKSKTVPKSPKILGTLGKNYNSRKLNLPFRKDFALSGQFSFGKKTVHYPLSSTAERCTSAAFIAELTTENLLIVMVVRRSWPLKRGLQTILCTSHLPTVLYHLPDRSWPSFSRRSRRRELFSKTVGGWTRLNSPEKGGGRRQPGPSRVASSGVLWSCDRQQTIPLRHALKWPIDDVAHLHVSRTQTPSAWFLFTKGRHFSVKIYLLPAPVVIIR